MQLQRRGVKKLIYKHFKKVFKDDIQVIYMPIKKDNPCSERDSRFSSKPIVVIRPLPIDPRQREISNGIVKPKMSK
jgi:hypothetical protein